MAPRSPGSPLSSIQRQNRLAVIAVFSLRPGTDEFISRPSQNDECCQHYQVCHEPNHNVHVLLPPGSRLPRPLPGICQEPDSAQQAMRGGINSQ